MGHWHSGLSKNPRGRRGDRGGEGEYSIEAESFGDNTCCGECGEALGDWASLIGINDLTDVALIDEGDCGGGIICASRICDCTLDKEGGASEEGPLEAALVVDLILEGAEILLAEFSRLMGLNPKLEAEGRGLDSTTGVGAVITGVGATIAGLGAGAACSSEPSRINFRRSENEDGGLEAPEGLGITFAALFKSTLELTSFSEPEDSDSSGSEVADVF